MRKVVYITASGEDFRGTKFDLTCKTSFAWSNELLGWSWAADGTTGAITRKARTYKLKAVSLDLKMLNEMSRWLEADADAGVQGKLVVDGWELLCNASVAESKRIGNDIALVTFTFHTVDPTWRRIIKHSLVPNSAGENDGALSGLDMPFDFEFDFAGSARSSAMESLELSVKSVARITFFGACSNPYVRISSPDGALNNVYGVNAEVDFGERVVIDPLGRKTVGGSVYKIDASGRRTNLYNNRMRGVAGSGSYVFESLPPCSLFVSWPQSFGVDIETIEERGSLPWN